MIVAERKPFAEIEAMLAPYKKVLIAGCGTCVAVCLTGGEKEVGLLAAELSIASQIKGKPLAISECTVERQCDKEFLEELKDRWKKTRPSFPWPAGRVSNFWLRGTTSKPVLPGVNTTFIGVNEAVGFWTERCRACHECVLDQTGGICPKTICAKGLLKRSLRWNRAWAVRGGYGETLCLDPDLPAFGKNRPPGSRSERPLNPAGTI